jgi:hypothetical protein
VGPVPRPAGGHRGDQGGRRRHHHGLWLRAHRFKMKMWKRCAEYGGKWGVWGTSRRC